MWRDSGAGKELCNEEETIREVAFVGDIVRLSGGCEATVTTGTRCGWV